MITPLSLDDPLETARYWGSTLLDAGAQTVINIIAVRRNIEVFFEDIKDLSGADHYHWPQATYRLMRAAAIVRFMARKAVPLRRYRRATLRPLIRSALKSAQG